MPHEQDGAPHVPVMVGEVMDILRPEAGGPYWDLTLGAGGHMAAFLAGAPPGTLAFGLDGDPAAIERGRSLPATLLHGDMAEIRSLARDAGWPRPRAVLLDLGLCSMQVDDPRRGFSYRHEGPLDMRMDPTKGPTAAEWLDGVGRAELERVIRELGEERFAGRIARSIIERRPIRSTTALCEAVVRAVGVRPRSHHPARRTFQAIRMAVNRELEKAGAGLAAAIELLLPGGRLAVLSFHSGEDRLVKHAFRDAAGSGAVRLLAKKPLTSTPLEARTNPRARSAKLRAVEKL